MVAPINARRLSRKTVSRDMELINRWFGRKAHWLFQALDSYVGHPDVDTPTQGWQLITQQSLDWTEHMIEFM